MKIKIRRALLSVSDKTGIVGLARTLSELGCELISTGGTRRELAAAGLDATDISSLTKNPEAFGGRMKTISFEIESALLFDRERDQKEASRLGIAPIDMVVCNLYPFVRARDAGADLPTLIEHIDVGGPTMIRAAAKNSRYVAVVTDPSQYAAIEQELRAHGGALEGSTRDQLMRAAFNLTADYEAAIAMALDERAGARSLRLRFEKGMTLRYGENPHQQAELFRQHDAKGSLADLSFLGGKELSCNNLTDLTAALEVVSSLSRRGCAIVKHANPCGLCEADDQRRALERAWAGDPVSAFGSVIAFNTTLEPETAAFLALDHPDKARRRFVEVVAAPEFHPQALVALQQSKNLRVVAFDPRALDERFEFRSLPGALLRQTVDRDSELRAGIEVVTRRPLPPHKLELLDFGLKAVRQLKSNAIVIVRESPDGAFELCGMGAGQPNRVSSTALAVESALANLATQGPGGEAGSAETSAAMGQAILVSDAFFPFPDSIERAVEAGIRTIYQPGGSLRDREVIARCDELGVAMAMTGRRHFRH